MADPFMLPPAIGDNPVASILAGVAAIVGALYVLVRILRSNSRSDGRETTADALIAHLRGLAEDAIKRADRAFGERNDAIREVAGARAEVAALQLGIQAQERENQAKLRELDARYAALEIKCREDCAGRDAIIEKLKSELEATTRQLAAARASSNGREGFY